MAITTANTAQRTARRRAKEALGPRYTQRLLAAYSVLHDGERLLHQYSTGGNFGEALSKVCDAFRELREVGDLDF